MNELRIEIRISNQTEAVYRFSTFPVRIGRDPSCQLAICHHAIARNLCSVWIESDGLIRLEERPNLTNPIIESGKAVLGGVSNRRLDVLVGPVQLRFTTERESDSLPTTWSRKRNGLLFGLFLLFAFVVARQYRTLRAEIHRDKISLSADDFPTTIAFSNEDVEHDTQMHIELTRKLAFERYYGIPHDIRKRRNAIELLMRVGKMESDRQQRTTNKQNTQNTLNTLERWKEQFNRNYHREVVALFAAQKSHDDTQASVSAKKLKMYLEHQDSKLIRWLSEIEQKGENQ